jgi:hypothetical protein
MTENQVNERIYAPRFRPGGPKSGHRDPAVDDFAPGQNHSVSVSSISFSFSRIVRCIELKAFNSASSSAQRVL